MKYRLKFQKKGCQLELGMEKVTIRCLPCLLFHCWANELSFAFALSQNSKNLVKNIMTE